MEKKTKIILCLRLILLVLLMVFLIIFNTIHKTNCEICSFEIEGEEYNHEQFFNMYYGKCLARQKIMGVPNFTFNP